MRRSNGVKLLGVLAWLGAGAALAGPQEIEAGPLWSQSHAQEKCPRVCAAHGRWTGHWWTTVPNQMSVCQCAPPEPTEEERTQRIVVHLRKARELGDLELWREAQAELKAARALRAGNLPVLQELCWVSIQLGDVAAAREACFIVYHQANTPSTKARACAHLGMLAEVEGSRTEAVTRYRESLALQPDKSIELRLRRLTGEREGRGRPPRARGRQ